MDTIIKPIFIQVGTEVREMTNAEYAQYETDQAAAVARIAAEEAALVAEEAAKQQAFNDAVAAAVTAALAAQQTPTE
jgi:hypothetical protein